MSAKHTPGPWLVRGKQSIRGFKGEYIASANWNNGAANARLIAAAPDLLIALREVLSVADRKTYEFDLARAAIALATGEAE